MFKMKSYILTVILILSTIIFSSCTQPLINSIYNKEYPIMNSEGKDESPDKELISIDTQELKYADYFATIKEHIFQVWTYPVEALKKGITGKGSLKLTINRDGNLVDINVVNSSGHKILDEATIKAFKEASPFKPIPDTLNKDKLVISTTFSYNSYKVLR